MAENQLLFYPCIADSNGRILKIVGEKRTKEEAEKFLKQQCRGKWLRCEAIPQPETMRGLHY